MKLRQIKKLSELIHPIERDVTYIIRDADSHHVFNSYNSHNDSIDNDSKYSKLVKDGETFELERKVNDLMTRVSAQCRHLMDALVKTDDFSRYIVKDSRVDVDVDELKCQAFEYVSSLEKIEIESYLSAAEYIFSYFDTSKRRSGRDQ